MTKLRTVTSPRDIQAAILTPPQPTHSVHRSLSLCGAGARGIDKAAKSISAIEKYEFFQSDSKRSQRLSYKS